MIAEGWLVIYMDDLLIFSPDEETVISLNLTKSSPNLGLPRSTSDHSDYLVHPQSPDLGPISGYLDHP